MSWFFRRPGLQAELDEEVRGHIEERTVQLMRLENLTREEARRRALVAFGNPALVRARSLEVWQWPALESILADLRISLRRLGRSPGFSVTVLLTLAIGVGANTAVFSVVDDVLLRPLPYSGAGSLVSIWLNAPGAAGLANFQKGLPLSSSMYFAFSENNRTFASLGIWTPSRANVTGPAMPEEVRVIGVSDGVLETLGVGPAAGRLLTASDQAPRGAASVVLGYGYWQRRFGGDRSVLGRSLVIDSRPRTVVGVMPRGFRLVDREFDVLSPLALERSRQPLAGFGFQGVGRLRPGVTIAEANADIARLIPVWMDSFSNGPGTDSHWYLRWRITPDLRPLKQEVVGNVGSVLWVVMGTIGVVLLIACVNVANLLLVRTRARAHELSIARALGAGRGRIARALITESLLLALAGGALGVAVAHLALRLLIRIGPANLPRLGEISLDPGSLLFALLLSLFSGLLFGSIPAWRYSRGDAACTLASTRTASPGRERSRTRDLLVVAQVAMALVLLVSALLMIRTFLNLQRVDPGFRDPATLETLHIAIPETSVADQRAVTRLEQSIGSRIAAIPGVTSAGFAALGPLEDGLHGWSLIYAEGRTYAGDAPIRYYNYISPGYLQALGTGLVAGRDFSWDGIYDGRPEVIVSENLAREEWGSAAAALGRHIQQGPGQLRYRIIGVARDLRQNGVDQRAPAIVYWPVLTVGPWLFPPRTVTFVVRSSRAGTEALLGDIQRAVSGVNAGLPVASPRTMQEIWSRSLARTSFTLVMLGIAASMALALGIIGIYGVIAYAVTERTREIGIRLALGAGRRELRWMFVRSVLILTAAGAAIGLAAAAATAQLMRSLLFGVSPLDPVSFTAVPLLLAGTAVLAGSLPARRISSINPVDALRAE